MIEVNLVSVVTPMYNAEETIKNCIKSVALQKGIHIEQLIIDDCSKDKSVELVEKLKHEYSFVRLIKNETNMGPAKTRNVGLSAAKGRYIAFLDSDDEWLENKLSSQLSSMEGFPLSCTEYYRCKSNGTIIRPIRIPKALIEFKNLLKTNSIYTSTVVVDKSIVGNFHMQDFYYDDFVCWLDLTSNYGSCKVIQIPLLKYKTGGKSVSSNKIKSAIKVYDIYREYLKYPWYKILYYMVFYTYYGLKKT